MREFKCLRDLADEKGSEIGASPWLTVDQERINLFAEATDDYQWIHVNPKRTLSELDMPTIAHGYLTLSLIPRFMGEVFTVNSVERAINYGANKLRFTNMVPVNSRVRGRIFLDRAVLGEKSIRTVSTVTIDIEGQEKPALIAETITLMFE
jgi:acyl dehydratase